MLLLSSFSISINSNVQLKPNVIVSPGCGKVKEYRMKLNDNGF
jgi:hypothetical protein